MSLIQQFEEIQFLENLTVKEFLEKTKFSKMLYYSIKNGEKTALKPTQKKTLSDAFPDYNFDFNTQNSYKNTLKKESKTQKNTTLDEQISLLIQTELSKFDLENNVFENVLSKIKPILDKQEKLNQSTQKDLLNLFRMFTDIKKEINSNNNLSNIS